MASRFLEEGLGGFFVEDARVDGAVVDLNECEERGQRQTPVPTSKRTVGKEREDESGDLFGKRRVGLATERRDLWALHRVEEAELRFDDSRLRLMAAELRAHRTMQFDEILNGEITNAAVSR